MVCSYWLAGCVCMCDFGACVCTCMSCLSSGIGFGVDPGPAPPPRAVCIDRRQTLGTSPRSGGRRSLETHTSTQTQTGTKTHLLSERVKTELTQAYKCNPPPTQTHLKPPSNSLQLYSSPSALYHQPFGGIYLPTHPSIHLAIDFYKLTSDPFNLNLQPCPFYTTTHL